MDAWEREMISGIAYSRGPTIGKSAAMTNDDPDDIGDLPIEDQRRIETEVARLRRTMIAAARRRLAEKDRRPLSEREKADRRALSNDLNATVAMMRRYANGESLNSLGHELGYKNGGVVYWKFSRIVSAVLEMQESQRVGVFWLEGIDFPEQVRRTLARIDDVGLPNISLSRRRVSS